MVIGFHRSAIVRSGSWRSEQSKNQTEQKDAIFITSLFLDGYMSESRGHEDSCEVTACWLSNLCRVCHRQPGRSMHTGNPQQSEDSQDTIWAVSLPRGHYSLRDNGHKPQKIWRNTMMCHQHNGPSQVQTPRQTFKSQTRSSALHGMTTGYTSKTSGR